MPAPGSEAIRPLVGRIFPGWACCLIERVDEGVSTYVYRLRRDGDIFYLRILPEVGSSFMPEAWVHQRLREQGVKVPEVVHVEHFNVDLQCSVMATTEVTGEHVGRCSSIQSIRQILIEVGRDLAILNSVPVNGFGWIKRDRKQVAHLEAEYLSFRAFALGDFEAHLATIGNVLGEQEIIAIRETIDQRDSWLDDDQAWLAHGDFDVTHIFQQGGRYTGIIDFGEIRGGDPFYDLGHFKLHDGETLPERVLPHLLEGYQDVIPLPPDYEQRIGFSSLLIGVRWLAHTMEKFPRCDFRHHQAVWSIKQDLATLDG